MKKTSLLTAIAASSLVCASSPSPALASDAIVRPFQTPRMMGMGGLKITTGLYDENFTGNPARASANPTWKVQLSDFNVEFNSDSIAQISDIIGGVSDPQLLGETLGDIPGKSVYLKNSNTFLGVYIPTNWLDVAFGMQTMVQLDAAVRRNYSINPGLSVEAGPSLTLSRKFLKDNELAVGLNTHYRYRAISSSSITLQSLLAGGELSLLDQTGDGAALDFDLGATYDLPLILKDIRFQVGISANNLLDASYNSGLQVLSQGSTTGAGNANRQFGLGIVATQKEVWKFKDALLGIELSDLGNNGEGSWVRMLHIGSEIGWTRFKFRLGLNQGYVTAGLGVDLWALQFDIATYGEELTLDAGGLENRVTALRLGIQI
jgi:hypothetical protein